MCISVPSALDVLYGQGCGGRRDTEWNDKLPRIRSGCYLLTLPDQAETKYIRGHRVQRYRSMLTPAWEKQLGAASLHVIRPYRLRNGRQVLLPSRKEQMRSLESRERTWFIQLLKEESVVLCKCGLIQVQSPAVTRGRGSFPHRIHNVKAAIKLCFRIVNSTKMIATVSLLSFFFFACLWKYELQRHFPSMPDVTMGVSLDQSELPGRVGLMCLDTWARTFRSGAQTFGTVTSLCKIFHWDYWKHWALRCWRCQRLFSHVHLCTPIWSLQPECAIRAEHRLKQSAVVPSSQSC